MTISKYFIWRKIKEFENWLSETEFTPSQFNHIQKAIDRKEKPKDELKELFHSLVLNKY